MSVITAAICEDEPAVLDYLCKQLGNSLRSDGNEYHFDCFTQGEDLLHKINSGTNYHLYFLDIEMPGINGIDVCRKIRSRDEDSLVIFISNKEEMVFQTFEVQPFRFIRKNHFMEELLALTDGIQKALARRKGIMLTIQEEHSNAVYSININEILYIEVVGKYCEITTVSQALTIRYKLSDLAGQLAEYGFLQPHRSYLVNYRYVFSIENTELILDDQTRIPLSRKRAKETKEQFMDFMRREI